MSLDTNTQIVMKFFFSFLNSEFNDKYNLRFILKENQLVIKNNYYKFKIRKIDENSFELFYLWNLGFLSIFLANQFSEMKHIYEAIKEYSIKKNLTIFEIHDDFNSIEF